MAHFNALEDAKKLNKAMKGLGTDEKSLNEVMGNRTKAQLLEIAKVYEQEYKTTLIKDIKGDTSGDYERLLVGLLSTIPQAKCALLKFATKGAGTAEKYLIDVYAPSSNAEILDVYQHDPTAIAAVLNDISNGDFDKVIKTLMKAKRDESPHVNDSEVAKVAEQFYKAGEAKLGTDEDTFTAIICGHSVEFLKQLSKVYAEKHKHTLEQAIKKETSGHYEDILIGLTKTRYEYFADRFYNATHGLGTDDHFLCYAFSVLSSEELHKVAKIFQERHSNTTFEKQIIGDVSGHYGSLIKLLLK